MDIEQGDNPECNEGRKVGGEQNEDEDRMEDEEINEDEGMDEWVVLDDIGDENEENEQTCLSEESNHGTDDILQKQTAEDSLELESRDDECLSNDERKHVNIGKGSRKRGLDGSVPENVKFVDEDNPKRFRDDSQTSQENSHQDSTNEKSGEKEHGECPLKPIICDGLLFEENMTCPFCTHDDKEYKTKLLFIIHWLEKHSFYTKKYPCPMIGCSEILKARRLLIRHAKVDHSEQQMREVNFRERFPEFKLRDDKETSSRPEASSQSKFRSGQIQVIDEEQMNTEKPELSGRDDKETSNSPGAVTSRPQLQGNLGEQVITEKQNLSCKNENQVSVSDSNVEMPTSAGKETATPENTCMSGKTENRTQSGSCKNPEGSKVDQCPVENCTSEENLCASTSSTGTEKSCSETLSSEQRNDSQQEVEEVDSNEVKFVAKMKCPICVSPQQFTREIEFLDHWNMYHTISVEKHFCKQKQCSAKFHSARFLQEHYKSEHNNGKDEITLDESNRVSKRTLITNPNFKNPQNLVFNPSVTKEFHFQPGSKCPVCVISAIHAVADTFEHHWIGYHCKYGTNFYCPNSDCNRIAQRLGALKKHYWEKHNYGNDMLTMTAIESLNDCKKTLYMNHFYYHPSPYYFREVDQYIAEFRAGMTCPICPGNILLETLQQYHSHWQTVHLKFSEKFLCPVKGCSSEHKMMNELRRHYVEEHNGGKYTLTENVFHQLSKAPKKRVENASFVHPGNCVFLSVKEKADEYAYVDILNFKKGMVCPLCPNVLSIKGRHLEKHWQEFHTLFPKAYVCPFKSCREFRPAIPELKHHYRVTHSNGFPPKVIITQVIERLKMEIIMNKDFIDPTHYRLSFQGEGADTE